MSTSVPKKGVGQGIEGALKERGFEPTKENIANIALELMGFKDNMNKK